MTTQNKKNRKRNLAGARAVAESIQARGKAPAKPVVTRALLRKAYLYVVGGWALGTIEVAKGIGVRPEVATALLKALEASGLIAGTHVNGERAVTWQSMYDIENSDPAETMKKARADFNAAFPTGRVTPAPVKTGRVGASGPQYTDEQLKTVEQARKDGLSWKAAAAKAGIKSPGYLSKTMKARGVK
jgi:hypothetical protein